MDLGRELWAQYLENFLPIKGKMPEIDRLRPQEVLKLIWHFNTVFAPMKSVLDEMPIQTAFDGEADAALIKLSQTGKQECFEGISLGAWRILYDRHLWSLCALFLEESNPDAFMIPIPRKASRKIRATAAWLYVLAGPGRSPSEQWRKTSLSEQLLAIPATLPTTRQ